MVISHDRQFLNAVCNKIVDVENNRLYEYEGSFGDCIQKKQMAIKSLQREFAHEAELLAFESEAISNRKQLAKNPSKALRRKLANIRRSGKPRPVDQSVTEIYGERFHANRLVERTWMTPKNLLVAM